MLTLPRVLVWVGAMALVIFVFVIYSSVRILKTTGQGHTATLDKPVLETAVFPGVPAAFAESWNTATHGTALTSQDYLWLTLHIANIGQSHVRGISADLMLLPAISALYPGSEAFVGTAAVVAQSTGQTRVTFALLSLAPGIPIRSSSPCVLTAWMAPLMRHRPSTNGWRYTEPTGSTLRSRRSSIRSSCSMGSLHPCGSGRLPAIQQEPALHREYHGVRRTARHNRAEHVTLLC